jgi:hypothetical protein
MGCSVYGELGLRASRRALTAYVAESRRWIDGKQGREYCIGRRVSWLWVDVLCEFKYARKYRRWSVRVDVEPHDAYSLEETSLRPTVRLSYHTPQCPALHVLVRATSTSEPRLSCVSIDRENQSGAE